MRAPMAVDLREIERRALHACSSPVGIRVEFTGRELVGVKRQFMAENVAAAWPARLKYEWLVRLRTVSLSVVAV